MELSWEFQFDDVSQNLEQHPLNKFRPIENEITVKISTSCQPEFTCSKLTIKVPERRVSIVNCQQVKVFQFAKFRKNGTKHDKQKFNRRLTMTFKVINS